MRPPPRRSRLGGSEAERSVSPRPRKVAGRRTASPQRSLTLLSIGEGTDGRRVSARLGFVPEGRFAPAVAAGAGGGRGPALRSRSKRAFLPVLGPRARGRRG